jgi:hypothetical protein
MAVSLAFLFQPSLVLRAILFAAFFLAAIASGKRISPIATLAVSIGIVAANLLVPVGKVLIHFGPLVITEFALLDGIGKALTFEGLIHISKASILPGVRLPGRFGSIVASAFIYYDRIVEYRGTIRASSLLADADKLMLRVSEGEAVVATPPARSTYPRKGVFILAVATALAYAVLILARFWR